MKKNQIRKSVAALAMAAVVSVSLLGYGCGSKSASSTAGVSGEFTGTAKGMGGDVTVTLTLTDGKITGCTAEGKDALGNISMLMEYMRMGAEVRMYTDYGFFVPMKGDCRFFCRKGVQVSIFAFGTQGLRGEGLAYPLRDFTNWWQGTLNEVTGEEFVIRGEGEYLVFINMPSVS